LQQWGHQEMASSLRHPFERCLSVRADELLLELRGACSVPWADFLLNPRRLRGSDFLMRWSQGQWSEERLTDAVRATGRYFALPYGPSGTAPDDDIRAFELYFERLEKAGLGKVKRPDLLVFPAAKEQIVGDKIKSLGGVGELPFTPEDDPRMKELLSWAIVAVECENSLWRASKMPDYGVQLKPQRRMQGKLGLKKSAVLPTVIMKEEDRQPLHKWQTTHGLPIHVWHVFYDLAFGIAFSEAERLIREGLIEPTIQVFQAPGGATTQKSIYKFYYHYAYRLGEAIGEPRLAPKIIDDKNGHILPYVTFEGGNLRLSAEALKVLDSLANDRAAKQQ